RPLSDVIDDRQPDEVVGVRGGQVLTRVELRRQLELEAALVKRKAVGAIAVPSGGEKPEATRYDAAAAGNFAEMAAASRDRVAQAEREILAAGARARDDRGRRARGGQLQRRHRANERHLVDRLALDPSAVGLDERRVRKAVRRKIERRRVVDR